MSANIDLSEIVFILAICVYFGLTYTKVLNEVKSDLKHFKNLN